MHYQLFSQAHYAVALAADNFMCNAVSLEQRGRHLLFSGGHPDIMARLSELTNGIPKKVHMGRMVDIKKKIHTITAASYFPRPRATRCPSAMLNSAKINLSIN
jgi:hypothetical protein